MHEIRATVRREYIAEVARLAREAGIERITIADAFIHGSDAKYQVVSVETSTPRAHTFVDLFLGSKTLTSTHYSMTSRELRAIIDKGDLADLTRPIGEPFPDVIQDLWQLSQVTPSYVARAAAGAILLATGIIDNNPVAIVTAAMFLPFLAQVLAISFGVWSLDRRLIQRGLTSLALSAACAFGGGAVVAAIAGGQIQFSSFKSPLTSLAISAAIGITAGLSETDDTGRRYLIGVAAAVQLAIFPVWLGAAFILGLPNSDLLRSRLTSFFVNLVTIALTAVGAYAALNLPRGRGRAATSNGLR